ncbi:amidohydrolase family protein [Gramella jeungdoensis]|uniref:Amidohydrolase family protein n=1 Tax=Gramella jeungdoensis TaxID=708091 RepID=A0ABT0YYF7_9FLAO|nr:amidohydrolase family protein [Gramella jeungdoensis]MCM8568504.1 amidohydrolase family protein [Gramella jeungdoensis]
MVIDTHQHFWIYDQNRHAWIDDDMKRIRKDFLPEDLKPVLDKNEVDACIAVQADQTEAENEFLLGLAGKNEFIKGIIGWVDFRSQEINQKLGYYSEIEKIKGFRHIVQGEPDHNFLLRPDFLNGISRLEKYGFVYEILVFPHQLGAVLEFVKRFPNQKFVIDHIAKPYIKDGFSEGWKVMMKEIAKYENVYCKLSGMITEADYRTWTYELLKPHIEAVIEYFGPKKLMFGSDWPVCLVAGEYYQVKEIAEKAVSGFSPSEQKAFWGQNAMEFYNL